MEFELRIRSSGLSDLYKYVEENKDNKVLLELLLKDANQFLNRRKEEAEYCCPELGGDYAEKARVTWEDIENLKYIISIITPKLLPDALNTETVTESPQIPQEFLDKLKIHKLIDENSLKWKKENALCAYFIEKYYDRQWTLGEKTFGVKNLRQSATNYSTNTKTNRKPKNHHIIDEIFGIEN